MKNTVEVNLPEDFIAVSELFNISLKNTLETLIRHITVYDFLAAKTDGPGSKASRILARYLDVRNVDKGRMNGEDPLYHVTFIQSIMALIKEKMEAKSTMYRKIINNWYDVIKKEENENNR